MNIKNFQIIGTLVILIFFTSIIFAADKLSDTLITEKTFLAQENLVKINILPELIELTADDTIVVPTKHTSMKHHKTSKIFSYLTAHSLPLTLIIFFALGILLTFTPCVLPLLPITVNIIVGADPKNSPYRSVILVSAYVLSMAVCYTVAGIAVAYLGATIQIFFQKPWFILLVCALLTTFAIMQLEIISPSIYNKLFAKLHFSKKTQNTGSLLSVIIMGAASALALSPCATPALIGILTYISQTGDPWLGGAALFSMSLGMGVPLVGIALIGKQILPKAGVWLHTTKQLTGFVLLSLVIWLLKRILPAEIISLLWLGLIIAAVIYLGTFNFKKASSLWEGVQKLVGICLVIGTVLFVINVGKNSNYFSKCKETKPVSQSVDLPIPANEKMLKHKVKSKKPIVTQETVKIKIKLDKNPILSTNNAPKEMAAQSTFEIINNLDNLTSTLAKIKPTGKPALLYFHANWCMYCKDLDTVFENLRIKGYLKQFTLLQVDLSDNTENGEKIMDKYQVFGLPAVLFFNIDGAERKDFRLSESLSFDEFKQHMKMVLE